MIDQTEPQTETPIIQTYVLYHANCMDGMGAAYAAWTKLVDFENVHYIAVQYGKPIPQMQDNSLVYILDFSYSRQEILDLKARMHKVVVLDHHKTAEEELKDIEDCFFDKEHSGASMAWIYFHPEGFTSENEFTHLPKVIKNIRDRDLWKFELSETKYVSKALQIQIKDFRHLHPYVTDDTTYRSLIAFGQQKDVFDGYAIEDSVNKASICHVDDLKIAFGNVTSLISEIGAKWCETFDVDFSMSYFISTDGKIVFSLRSRNGRFDVAAYAKTFGGGGHAAAAGFTKNFPEGMEIIEALYEGKVK